MWRLKWEAVPARATVSNVHPHLQLPTPSYRLLPATGYRLLATDYYRLLATSYSKQTLPHSRVALGELLPLTAYPNKRMKGSKSYDWTLQ